MIIWDKNDFSRKFQEQQAKHGVFQEQFKNQKNLRLRNSRTSGHPVMGFSGFSGVSRVAGHPGCRRSGTTDKTFQQSGKQDSFRHLLKNSASM